jgi:hypothetical protein
MVEYQFPSLFREIHTGVDWYSYLSKSDDQVYFNF